MINKLVKDIQTFEFGYLEDIKVKLDYYRSSINDGLHKLDSNQFADFKAESTILIH